MARYFIYAGVVLIILGVCWPWITKIGIGRLPGDIVVEKEDFKLYFPITTSILISLVLSVLVWIFKK